MTPFARIREERLIRLEVAAARLGISPGYLRRLEAGKARLSLPLARRMAGLYLCSLGDLVRL
jgi:transcriptional regulator with XRE-family HTH domain